MELAYFEGSRVSEQLIPSKVNGCYGSLRAGAQLHRSSEDRVGATSAAGHHLLRLLPQLVNEQSPKLRKCLDIDFDSTYLHESGSVQPASLRVGPRYSLQEWGDIDHRCSQAGRIDQIPFKALYVRENIGAVVHRLELGSDGEQRAGIRFKGSCLVGPYFGLTKLVRLSGVFPCAVTDCPSTSGCSPVGQVSEAETFGRITHPHKDQPAEDSAQKCANSSCDYNVPSFNLPGPAVHADPSNASIDRGILA